MDDRLAKQLYEENILKKIKELENKIALLSKLAAGVSDGGISTALTIGGGTSKIILLDSLAQTVVAEIFQDGAGNLQFDLVDATKAFTFNDGNIIVNHGAGSSSVIALYENNIKKASAVWDAANENLTFENFENLGNILFAMKGEDKVERATVFDRTAGYSIFKWHLNGAEWFREQAAAPPTPDANYGMMYSKSDGSLHYVLSSGFDRNLSAQIPIDGWIPDANTWTYYNRTQAFTNDPAAGVGITLNMVNTANFIVGSDVEVSSSAGTERTYVTAVVPNTSITVNNLYLNHTTTSRLVTLLNVFTITGDVTAIIKKSAKVKWTQTTVKYGNVVSSAYSAPNTYVTLAINTDYLLTNAAISANYYSYLDNPAGFPTWFNYDPAPIGWSVRPTVGAGDAEYYYRLEGNGGWVVISQGNSAGTSDLTTTTFSSPVTTTKIAATVQPVTMDNGVLATTAPGKSFTNVNSRTITSRSNLATGAWTAANGKRVVVTLPLSW